MRQVLVQNGPTAEVVILGNSYAAWGIDAQLLPCSAINLANLGQTLDIDAALVRRYMADWKNLQVLILPVAWFSFQARLSDVPQHQGRLEAYRKVLELEVLARQERDTWELKVNAHSPREMVTLALEGIVPGQDERRPTTIVESKALPAARRPSRWTTKMRIRQFNEWMIPENEPELTNALKEILQRGRTAGINTLLLVMPLPKNFVSELRRGELEGLRGKLSSIAREYGSTVADFSIDPRFSVADFADSDHLNSEGARRLSRILADEVLPSLARCVEPESGRRDP